jgi:hypothetical protein
MLHGRGAVLKLVYPIGVSIDMHPGEPPLGADFGPSQYVPGCLYGEPAA